MNPRAQIALALRGLSRNRRRSLATWSAVVLGFAAIALFAGYAHNIYRGLALQAVHGELLGHLSIAKRGMSREGKLDPERYLLTAGEAQGIAELLRREAGVELVMPRLTLSGIVSNGRASTIFVAEGVDPQAARRLWQGLSEQLGSRPRVGGGVAALDAAKPDHVALAAGLASILKLQVGDSAALLTNTLGGQANALDIVVGGSFSTGNAGTNDLYAFMPLELVRSLYDAAGRADRLTVLLADADATDAMRTKLQAKLAAAGFDVEIKTWRDLSAFYNQVRAMFDMIFAFIFGIVVTVVVMSIANAMGMTVVERTREIGTLRALGLKRHGVVSLFVGEAALLVVLGCLGGLLLTVAVRYAINASGISYIPPNQTAPVPLLVDLDTSRIVLTGAILAVVGALAAWIPARRAARQPIVEALGHV